MTLIFGGGLLLVLVKLIVPCVGCMYVGQLTCFVCVSVCLMAVVIVHALRNNNITTCNGLVNHAEQI